MEDRKEVVNRYISKVMKATKAAQIADFSRSGYYYMPNGRRLGESPTLFTLKKDGTIVENSVVVQTVKEIINPNFIDYGYEKVTVELHKNKYIINRKKVYRLMKENRLLNPKRVTPNQLKNHVKYSHPHPSQSLEVFEIDIKYIYIRGDRRNAFPITIIDVFTRNTLVWDLAFSMKSERVNNLFDQLILNYLQPGNLLRKNILVTIRSDNENQFVAKVVREHLKGNQIFQKFIKPATPEQNGYIELFTALLKSLFAVSLNFKAWHMQKLLTKYISQYLLKLKKLGFPRDQQQYSPKVSTLYRDRYFKALFDILLKGEYSSFQGINLWIYSGKAVPQTINLNRNWVMPSQDISPWNHIRVKLYISKPTI